MSIVIEVKCDELVNAMNSLVQALSDKKKTPPKKKEEQKVLKGQIGIDAASTDEKVTCEDVKTALYTIKNEKGASAAKDLLKSLGYEKLSDLPESEYPKVMKEVEEALK